MLILWKAICLNKYPSLELYSFCKLMNSKFMKSYFIKNDDNVWWHWNFSPFINILLLTNFIDIYRRRQWHPTPGLLPGKSHGWRSLGGCRPWGRKESDMTERLHFHFALSCIGEGNGNPLQCSCLENPRDRGAWWLPSMGSHRVGHDWSDLAAAVKLLYVTF